MKIKEQCVSLELAKRLKKAGIKQESFFWFAFCDDKWTLCQKDDDFFYNDANLDPNVCSAFTATELGELLPSMIKLGNAHFFLTMNETRQVFYQNPPDEEEYWDFEMNLDHTEADSRASMILHLLKYNLMELPE
jgi:hypothetical protein